MPIWITAASQSAVAMPSGVADSSLAILHALIFDADGHAVLPRPEPSAENLAYLSDGQAGHADLPHRTPDSDTLGGDNLVSLERRLAQAILKIPSECHLQPMVFILGEAAWALTRWEAGCYWAVVCTGALAEIAEGERARLEAFLHQLADCVVFFCGSEELSAGIRKKSQFVELILELITAARRAPLAGGAGDLCGWAMRGCRINFDVFNVDFLRRATPPRLREQGLPADTVRQLQLHLQPHHHHIITPGSACDST